MERPRRLAAGQPGLREVLRSTVHSRADTWGRGRPPRRDSHPDQATDALARRQDGHRAHASPACRGLHGRNSAREALRRTWGRSARPFSALKGPAGVLQASSDVQDHPTHSETSKDYFFLFARPVAASGNISPIPDGKPAESRWRCGSSALPSRCWWPPARRRARKRRSSRACGWRRPRFVPAWQCAAPSVRCALWARAREQGPGAAGSASQAECGAAGKASGLHGSCGLLTRVRVGLRSRRTR